MKFYEVVEQVHALLQRQGRVSYRALKREFGLDDDYVEDLKAELIEAQRIAADEDGKVLVWIGEGVGKDERVVAPPPSILPLLMRRLDKVVQEINEIRELADTEESRSVTMTTEERTGNGEKEKRR